MQPACSQGAAPRAREEEAVPGRPGHPGPRTPPLTMTTEGWAEGAGRSSPARSSAPGASPSTSVTVSSMVACLAFIVSILHLELSEAISSW